MASEFVSYIGPTNLRINESNTARAASSDSSPKVEGGKPAALGGGKIVPAHERKDAGRSDELANAVSELNDYVQNVQRDLEFSIDEDSGRTIIKVIDSESKEVIRQIPPEEALAIARRIDEGGDGTILQVKA